MADAKESDAITKYYELSGGEFQRFVRDDPDKWAQVFVATAFPKLNELHTTEERESLVSAWFRDAMEAARKGSIREAIKPVIAELKTFRDEAVEMLEQIKDNE